MWPGWAPPGGVPFAKVSGSVLNADVWATDMDTWQTVGGKVVSTGTDIHTNGTMWPRLDANGDGEGHWLLFPRRPVVRPRPGAPRDHRFPSDAQYQTLDAEGVAQVDVPYGPDCLYLALEAIAAVPVAAAMTRVGRKPNRGTVFSVPQMRDFVAHWVGQQYDNNDPAITALVNGSGTRDQVVAAIRRGRTEQDGIGGYLAGFVAQAFNLRINLVQDDTAGLNGSGQHPAHRPGER